MPVATAGSEHYALPVLRIGTRLYHTTTLLCLLGPLAAIAAAVQLKTAACSHALSAALLRYKNWRIGRQTEGLISELETTRRCPPKRRAGDGVLCTRGR